MAGGLARSTLAGRAQHNAGAVWCGAAARLKTGGDEGATVCAGAGRAQHDASTVMPLVRRGWKQKETKGKRRASDRNSSPK